MNKFLLIDDHVVVRSGIKALLLEIFKPCEIFEASDGESAVEQLKQRTYDLVIMDIQMPSTDAFGLMEYMRISHHDAKVLIFSMSAENIYAKRFLKAGAKGFVSKESSLEEIKKAITLVLDNKRYISEAMIDILAEGSSADAAKNPFQSLSARELEITSLLLSGDTLSEIARSLHIQVSTAGTHKSRLFEKLGVTNVLELKEMADFYKL
jgi:two-component system invasion response regulator UvrY